MVPIVSNARDPTPTYWLFVPDTKSAIKSVSITSLPFPLEIPIEVGNHSVEPVSRDVKDVWPTIHEVC